MGCLTTGDVTAFVAPFVHNNLGYTLGTKNKQR